MHKCNDQVCSLFGELLVEQSLEDIESNRSFEKYRPILQNSRTLLYTRLGIDHKWR